MKLTYEIILLFSLYFFVYRLLCEFQKYKNLQAEQEELKSALQKCKESVAECQSSKEDIVLEYKTRINDISNANSAKDGKIKGLEEQMEYLKKNNNNLLDRLSDLSVVSKAGAESIKKSLDAMNEKTNTSKILLHLCQKGFHQFSFGDEFEKVTQ